MTRFNQKGVTLLELLAAIALMSVVLGLCFTLIHTMTSGFRTITARESVQEQARMITEQISNKVRETPATITNIEKGILVAELNDNTLTGDYTSFVSSGTELRMKTKKGSNTTEFKLAENLAAANVRFIEADKKVMITLQFTVDGKTSHEYETSVYLPEWAS